MKTKRKIGTGFAMTILFILLITTMFAQQPDQPPRAKKINREQVPPPNAPIAPVPPETEIPDVPSRPNLNIPDLTPEQHDKVSQADLDHLKAMTPWKNQIREKKARLQTILTTSPFDAKSAELIAEELGKIETTILKEKIRHDQALRILLTPPQQVIFDSRLKPFLGWKK